MMWELIAANRKRSLFLFSGMAVVLCVLGYLFGHVTHPDGGGMFGLIMAIAIWVILSLLSVFGGGDMILHLIGAKQVTPDVHPQLHNVVEEMKIASALPVMPKIYIVDSKAPNAFATGLNPENAAVAVTSGLLAKLNRDELQGVVAHEMAHIVNRDVQFMTLASIMLGSIVMLSQVFLRGMWLTGGGGSSRRYRSKGGGAPVHPAIMIITIALAILGPIFARVLYLSISRKREYLADACSARFTRYPEGLASALEKISTNDVPLDGVSKATAPMFIVNPLRLKSDRALSGWDSTHPPIEKRIAILRGMTTGANLLTYQRSYAKVMEKSGVLIPTSGLKQDEELAIRAPHPDAGEQKTPAEQTREAMDLMRAVDGFAFLVCACGLKLKVPPEFKDTHIVCPRCKRDNEVPRAQISQVEKMAAMVGALTATENEIPSAHLSSKAADPGAADAPLEYRRRTNTWESFTCACGNLLQLSPAFNAGQITCRRCKRVTRIL